MDVFWKAADGTGEVEHLIESDGQQSIWTWSPDGQTAVVNELRSNGSIDIGFFSMDRPDEPVEWVLDGDSNEGWPDVSPDGRWIAYIDDASGQYEVVVRPFPNVGDGRWQISRDGGFAPVWGPDSRELFYQTSEGSAITVMMVENDTEPTFSPGNPVPLFEGPYRTGVYPNPRVYDVSPDGQRFLMVKEPTGVAAQGAPIILVQNWFEGVWISLGATRTG